ncbi:phenylhydantoinase [Aphanothece sacrum FPU1]|uniref:Phenylhydantoinase n=1 Tax=Aphanothece sacrum FPU1 TaxID=1920663 RepID=A0A401ID90_APHSA|nr:phenylhydantoinase [Aphanothece sacrum FPU1]GBF86529.1 phenylhydantoinase [Aphanothece sacrum FPU3]
MKNTIKFGLGNLSGGHCPPYLLLNFINLKKMTIKQDNFVVSPMTLDELNLALSWAANEG